MTNNGLKAALAMAAMVASTTTLAQAPADVAQAASDVCAGKLKSEALVSAAIARAKERIDLNAFVTLDEAGALSAAKQIDAVLARSRGQGCRPLTGVPIVIKDNIHVAGLPNTGGTPALKDFKPKADAPVVRKLRAAGAIIIGKTHMHELAFGISGYNPAFQTGTEVGVRNAYDTSKSAGGSSSGTGAALGARVVLAGLAPTPGARCASRARSTAAWRCVRRSGAIRSKASCRSRTRATPPVRWRWRSPTWNCSTA
jgi:Asp-tRNA(Asn)/Glu-tRNA(Gln) amidotransferase A subunit family amidase